MQRDLLATPEKAKIVLGRSWTSARDKIIDLVSRGYHLITVVGRAGSGKTHIALNVYHSLAEIGYVCTYVDAALAPSKDISSIAQLMISENASVISDLLRRARDSKISDRRLRALSKLNILELSELARRSSVQLISYLHDLVCALGLRGLVLILDEGILSQDDPRAQEFVATLHLLRNLLTRLCRLIVITTMLPDALDYVSKVDAPLFEILSLGVVSLPDYVSREDMIDIAKAYGLTDDAVNYILSLGNLTMRQVLCLVMSGLSADSLAKCNISEVAVDVRLGD